MKTIWKFDFDPRDCAEIAMPRGAAILCVQVQAARPCLWAIVDTEAQLVTRQIHIRGTGHALGAAEGFAYIGTFQLAGGLLVFHVFGGGELAT